MSIPLRSPYNYPGADANDGDLTTFARTKDPSESTPTIEIELEDTYYVAYIKLYLPFYTSKFYDPEPQSNCFNSLDDYHVSSII